MMLGERFLCGIGSVKAALKDCELMQYLCVVPDVGLGMCPNTGCSGCLTFPDCLSFYILFGFNFQESFFYSERM